ncbi:MAG TPA: enolase C-terminal domain-like protein [Actinomycetota bacterium]|nr:enolase C-terminal domain-like protein [Actinomycetota bacterium]
MEIEGLESAAYTIPTERPESDGTLAWDSTTAVTAVVRAGGTSGLGLTYGATACATLIRDTLADLVTGVDALDVPSAWRRMVDGVRNLGRPGVASYAIAAVDVALWDLKARLLDLPLFRLLGAARDEVPVYASGGFTSASEDELAHELGGWVHGEGISRVKMKIAAGRGADPHRDLRRVARARRAIGHDADLMVDANGGYTRKQAVAVGRRLEDLGVTWFEEPVSSDDLDGLAEIRGLTAIDVAAGEYGHDVWYFERLAPVVDVLQADVSRCMGITEWLRAAAVAAAHNLDLSGHTAQSLHLHPACAIQNLRHVEYFHDHRRVERILFDGVVEPQGGRLRPDPSRPGVGLDLKEADAEPYRAA